MKIKQGWEHYCSPLHPAEDFVTPYSVKSLRRKFLLAEYTQNFYYMFILHKPIITHIIDVSQQIQQSESCAEYQLGHLWSEVITTCGVGQCCLNEQSRSICLSRYWQGACVCVGALFIWMCHASVHAWAWLCSCVRVNTTDSIFLLPYWK